MPIQNFSIGEAFKKGWELTKEHLGFLIGYQIILFLLTIIFSGGSEGFLGSIWRFIGFVVVVIVKMGLYNSALLITNNIKPTFEQLYANWRLTVSWVIANFFFAVMFLVGLILLIAPGLYVLARYGFFPFMLLDRDLGPVEALKQSAQATEGIRWQLLLLLLACIGLNILGLLFFGVGLLITFPVTLLAVASVYRRVVSTPVEIVKV